MSMLFGKSKKNNAAAAKDGVSQLRDTLETLQKRESFLEKKIEAELINAKKNATKNKRGKSDEALSRYVSVAIQALRRKKAYEGQIEKIASARITIETQLMTIENAQMNKETLDAMKAGASTLKGIHGQMKVDEVDTVMDDIQEQMDIAATISDAIAQPIGSQMDEDELNAELEELEQEQLDAQFVALPSQPSSLPAFPEASKEAPHADEDEERALRDLEKSMAM